MRKSKIKFLKAAIWKKPLDKSDCYFCMTNVTGINKVRPDKILYATVSSVVRPQKQIVESFIDEASRDSFIQGMDGMQVACGTEEDVENLNHHTDDDTDENESLTEAESESVESEEELSSDSDEEYVPIGKEKSQKKISQAQLNDMFRNAGLAKDAAELMASQLKSYNVLEKDVNVTFYRNREEAFRTYFTGESDLVYCTDVRGLINEFKPNLYEPEEWRLFIDSSKRSLKAVLLHNTNVYAPLPLAHSTVLKEEYCNIEKVLNKIKYSEHEWLICGDLKILSMILGQQSGFTKYPCYLCMFDSRDRAKHYNTKVWPARPSLTPGSSNVINRPLVDPSKILLPPLHIKLGLMKQFVKALDKEGRCFKYLETIFTNITLVKLKAGIFDGPQIRQMFRNEEFVKSMNDTEKAAWLSFKDVATKFLGNNKDENYKSIVETMVQNFKKLGCLMNLKLHFLDSHIDEFPPVLGDYSEEHGERFHQDMKEFERRWQGKYGVNMMADYCWMLKRDVLTNNKKRRRNPLHRSFDDKRIRKRKPI